MNENEYKKIIILAVGALVLTFFSLVTNVDTLGIEITGSLRSSNNSLTNLGTGLSKFGENLSRLASLAYENEQLRSENESLVLELTSYRKAEDLKDYLTTYGLKKSDIVANAIAPATTLSDGFVYINKGTKEGISNNDLVVQGNYLVGIVDKVSLNYSKVKLVTSVDFSYAVSVNGDLGMAKGFTNIAIKVEELDQRAKIQDKEEVILLPTNEIPLLGNYKLGSVNKINRSTSGELISLEVKYPINLANLTFITIIKNEE